MRTILRTLIPVWFLLILFLASHQAFIGASGKPPIAVGLAFAAPILLFIAAVQLSPALRTYVLNISPIFLASLHGWRLIGFGFLMAYSEHLLSASFAMPAAFGDIAVAIFAPLVVLRLATDASFIRTPSFAAWNLFGIADFVVAIATGALNQGFLPSFHPTITGALMARLPFALIPCFLVPWLFITHIILLMQSRASYSYLNASAGNTLAALPLG
jgi:hypothetical protein